MTSPDILTLRAIRHDLPDTRTFAIYRGDLARSGYDPDDSQSVGHALRPKELAQQVARDLDRYVLLRMEDFRGSRCSRTVLIGPRDMQRDTLTLR